LASYFGVSYQAAVGSDVYKESETPPDLPLFQLLGCENILLEQIKTENFMQVGPFWAMNLLEAGATSTRLYFLDQGGLCLALP
jgi:hypothetical protein